MARSKEKVETTDETDVAEQTKEPVKAAKWMKQLNNMEGAVDFEYQTFAPENMVRSTSPYVNWIFGKGSGLARGLGAIFYGQPKSGKSLLSYLFTAGLHASDPEALVIKFNTEMREASQIGDKWGIDRSRYAAYDVNEPELIFDRLKKEILPMVQDGMPLKLIIIDSLQGVSGVKEQDRDSITNHLMGDHAKTIQDGLKAILPILRRHKIGLICTEHIRANLDAGSYGKKEKMAGGYGEKHFFEYYVEVKRDTSPEGKVSSTGEKFEGEVVDARGDKEKTGHKIYVRMEDSSTGVARRSGIFTFNYDKGLINVEEEVFELGKAIKLIERPNNRTYIAYGQTYTSKELMINEIRDNKELQAQLLKDIYARDKA